MTSGTESVITCDREGRIESFGPGAERTFGYRAEEMVGKKRIAVLSPGPIAFGQLGTWLASARKDGGFRTRTVFVKKGGIPFTADVEITPVRRGEEHVGYRSVTVPRPEVPVEEAMPKPRASDWIRRWVVILRLPFASASVMAVLIGGAWAVHSHPGSAISPVWLSLILLGAVAVHVAANVFNDYFDWETGVDPANTEFFSTLSGGSRAVELGLIRQREAFKVAVAALSIAAAIGLFLVLKGRTAILWFALFGAFSAYFYSAPPLRLAGRKGMGEFLIGLNFGVLASAGTVYALTGVLRATDFWIGAPIGLLTTAILYINEFPDMVSDAATGKEHLVVVLGKRRARFGYLLLLVSAFALQIWMVATGLMPKWALLALLTLPLAYQSSRVVFRSYDDRSLVAANRMTILLQLLFGVFTAAGIFFS
jgi:1,4-dihydroxy-2-naphthoate polyprenyltransferase